MNILRNTFILLVLLALAPGLIVMSPSAQAQANVESDKLARFVALMQYIRTQPTPSDVHSNALGTLDVLDEALTDIYIEGFIAPFTGETAEEIRQRLESVSEEDRYAAAMVESYRLASSPVLLDITHDLLARYYVDLLTTGDLSGALGFMGKSEIQTLASGFDSSDYAIPAPSAVQGSGVPSPSTRTVSEVESDKLTRFVAVMQYIRTRPTPSDVHSNALGTLDFLDDALTDIYIDGFIAPFTGESAEEVERRLESVSEENRYAAAMVESYRLASSPVLLDIVHDLLARYYVDLLTTGDLSGALGFMDKAKIQGLANGFAPGDYAIPMPSATPSPSPTSTPLVLPGTTGIRYFDDPDIPYLSWEVGPNVPDSMFYDMRRGIVLAEQYIRSLDVPDLENEAVFYLYWDVVPAMARVMGRSEQELRERDRGAEAYMADDGLGAIFVNGSAFEKDGVSPVRMTHVAAHELIHIYQNILAAHRGFDLDHSKVRVHGPAWLQEGGAEFQTHRALTKGAVYFYDERRRRSSETASAVDTPLSDLETYKAVRATPGSYQLGEMAVELLADRAGEEAVIAYWPLLGPETSWQEAFATTFGMTIDEFYAVFEEHRAAGFPAVGLREIGPSLEDLPQQGRPALVALYNATDGANWSNNSNWNSDAHISRWHGVTINPSGRVTEVRLTRNGLRGRLPPELGSLTELRDLSVWANELTGPIPPELVRLSRLEVLGLGGNQFSGEIPSWIGGLGNLRVLHLPSNQFTGQIPSWIGDLRLHRLYLADNQLSGDIPAEVGNLSGLRALWLGGNDLTGCIPDELRDVPENDFAETSLPFCGEPDASLSLSVETELAGYWSSGEGGVDVKLTLMDTVSPWREGFHTISIVCHQDGAIVEGCGGELTVILTGEGRVATSNAILRTPMGDVSFEFDYGGTEPVTTQFHVPERILGVEKDVWECYSDQPDTLESDAERSGYYGDCAGWGNFAGLKWDQDVPVKVWATGLESYIAILRESLEELSPLLDLEFVWADSEEEAALKAYMGLPASQATSFGFTQRCAESYGCVGLGMITNEGVVKGGRMSVWLNQDTWWRELGLLDERIKRTTVHEALHALVPMHHREDPGSIMNNRALLLPTPNRMDEALIRLHQHRLVKPGMTPGDIEPLIVFREDLLDSPSAPEQDGYELARSAFEALQEADSARFRIRGGWSGSNCDRSFGWADLEIIDFSPSHPRITRFKDSSVHFFMIHPAGRGGKLELWSEENGQWMEVGPSGIHDNSHWNRGFSRVHRLLASVLFFSDADEIRVLRDTEGLITLNVTLNDAYIVLPWSGGETLEVVLTLKEDTLEILEYDFRWTFDVPSGNPCTSYTTTAVDGKYGIDIQFPDAILEGSANLLASR